MRALIRIVVALAFASASAGVLAQAQQGYIAEFRCEGGFFGLRLPPKLPSIMKLGQIESERALEPEKWDGYTTTQRYIYFSGFTIGLIVFSNDPDRYMVSSAHISDPKWSQIAPFRVGESIDSIRRKLGRFADGDPGLKSGYGSEDGEVRFETAVGKVIKISYDCYTG